MQSEAIFTEIGRAAIEYAKRGWHVFPAPPSGKLSYENAANNDGRRWGASDDPETVMALFARHPRANLGIATQESEIFVIDCDIKGGVDGVSWLAEQIQEHDNWPDTIEAQSPSGSWHVYFRYPEDFDPKTCQGEVAPGVDIRAHGGMVIAPPSVKAGASKPYRWKNPPGMFEVAEAPQWVLDLLPRRKEQKGNANAGPSKFNMGGVWRGAEDYRQLVLAASTDGQKHAATRDIAASLRGQGVSERFATGLIQAICPVWDRNLQNSIESAYAKFSAPTFRHEGLQLVRDDKDRPIWNIHNAETLLTQHPQWQGVLGFNAFTGRRMILAPIPGTTEGERDLNDDDYTAATGWFNCNGFPKAGASIVVPALRRACRSNTFNPLTDYLEGLQWDGGKRIGRWLIDYCGAEDTRFNREAGARWMISAVARAFHPGVKVDHMLVLEGDQGAGKSSGIRALAGGDDWFGDNLPDMGRKDAQEYVAGKWIIEVAELVAARRDIDAVKAFITRQTDEFRWSYDREVDRRPRQCVFIGTTNDDHYLRDETGNRRFWPVRIDRMDVERIKQDRSQLWAEAVALYRKGTKWWLPPEVETLAKEAQAARLDTDPWQEDVAAYIADKDAVTPREVLVWGLSKDAANCTRQDSNRVVGILQTLGFERDARLTAGDLKGHWNYRRRAS
ncbi:VapE domain-containing protein [Tropicimonas sediminicola]|uniref:Predicted P-loop ATPase and inactivated derivatives n=1 Tax=Tropicimonas sediminicola TaxID=1031541 RepID=A0A239KTG6_9RHOB|nr:VapE domain-containing protein [Tropicimonas sediminicola]SNT21657.1 Predicted P-loop ATPase and inactivated derivatives [Tropicimonas sediminicola]